MPANKISGKAPRSTRAKKTTHYVKKKQPPKARWLWIWLGLTGVAMLSATAGAILAVSINATPLLQAELTPEEEAIFGKGGSISRKSLRLPELTRPVNILLLGTKVLTSDLDEPPEEEGYHALVNSFDGLSDTMLLLRFDPKEENLTLLSIPRDTRAYIEDHGTTKINEANYYGGPALAAKSISELVGGVEIDRYIRVNVQGVEKLIDALGGVTVYVPKDMKYQDDSQHLYINLKKGKQHLDGEEAMQFLRFRYDEYGDIGRVQRQQTLMRAIVEQSLNPGVIVRVPKIIEVIKSHIDTNLSVEELVALTGFASQTDRSKVQMMMLPGEFNGTGREGVSYWIPHENEIRDLATQYFDRDRDRDEEENEKENTTDPANITVAIQDSTDSPRAVRRLVEELQELGYNDVYIDKDWPEPLKVTRIIAQNGDNAGAAVVKADLDIGEIRVESTGSLRSDVTIQLGKDWLKR
ncbi:MAG: LCP family protein [Spirulinaceae cyanobacterium]